MGQKAQGICWFDLGSLLLHCELKEIVESMNAPNGRLESMWTAGLYQENICQMAPNGLQWCVGRLTDVAWPLQGLGAVYQINSFPIKLKRGHMREGDHT